MSIANKLNLILSAKSAIKTALSKYYSSVGDNLSDYATKVEKIAEMANSLGYISCAERVNKIIIPFKEGAVLKPYLFYSVRADDIYIEEGYTSISQRVFQSCNYYSESSISNDIICRIHLPNTITDIYANTNVWAGATMIQLILQDGWNCNLDISSLSSRAFTQDVLEDMIDALIDLTGEEQKILKLTSDEYDLISAGKIAEGAAKNWIIQY